MKLSRKVARRRRAIVEALLLWWEANGRTFPWRGWTDVYRLLVAEVLLRQTRADAVAAFVPAFFERYPDPDRLAIADEDELAGTLRPLGFSRQRSAQLHQLGACLTQGPVSLVQDELLALPGIGRYSAGMVAAAGGQRVPAVDTNVARVLCRLFSIEPSHAEARKSTNVWLAAEQLVSVGAAPARVTWALLDLASAVCLQNRPRCAKCPVQRWCDYSKMATRAATAREAIDLR
jgi:A/G-specific adenine glycosylase